MQLIASTLPTEVTSVLLMVLAHALAFKAGPNKVRRENHGRDHVANEGPTNKWGLPPRRYVRFPSLTHYRVSVMVEIRWLGV